MKPTSELTSELLGEICHLMELHGENPFKTRAFEKASGVVLQVPDLKERAQNGTLTEVSGIGKGIAEVLREFLLEGKSTLRDTLKTSLPAGLLELTQVPGLGPKKAKQVIDELGIHSVSELEYACRENRLIHLKGFGEKAQKKVLEGILFLNSTRGRVRIDEGEVCAQQVLEQLRKITQTQVEETGALRRKLEILESLDFLVALPDDEKKAKILRKKCESQDWKTPVPVQYHFAGADEFGSEWARTTASAEHWAALHLTPKPATSSTEEDFFQKQKLPWIAPEMRETGEEIKIAREGKIDQVIQSNQLRGAFHCHSTASDGTASLEDMVREAQRLGYQYLGISDHSVSAHYAQGLNTDALKKQEREVREVQEKFPDIRIFWGIESDILGDGELDYEASVLKRFDFVIASIHSRFAMGRDEMTERLLRAIRNPYTRFVGHLTGRLLLGRKPYEFDLEKVVREAAEHDVAIEINAHPSRLDIDWRAGPLLRQHGTLVSVNPDAHDLEGLGHLKYGITVARKALLPTAQVVNTRSAGEVEKWLNRSR